MAQVKILQSNDDGWAVANIRALNTALNEAGFNVVLSAPAENESGTGSSDATPTTVGSSGCQFSSCPPNSPATGSDPDDARLNYVNSFPVTSVRIGIQTTGPLFFGGTVPDLVVTGPNVGTNLGSGVLTSGTVGAACEGAKEGIPSIAFSGSGGSQVSYTTLDTPSASTTTANVFANLSTTFIQALLNGTSSGQGEAILPPGIILNVNFHGASGSCDEAGAYTFVLTRVNTAASGAAADVETCGSDRLLTESHVVGLGGCFASVSVMNATSKGDVDAGLQGEVLGRLEGFLGCT